MQSECEKMQSQCQNVLAKLNDRKKELKDVESSCKMAMFVFGAIVAACVVFSILAAAGVVKSDGDSTAIALAVGGKSLVAGALACWGVIHYGNKKADNAALISEIEKVEK